MTTIKYTYACVDNMNAACEDIYEIRNGNNISSNNE
jgi:hypothetical protein